MVAAAAVGPILDAANQSGLTEGVKEGGALKSFGKNVSSVAKIGVDASPVGIMGSIAGGKAPITGQKIPGFPGQTPAATTAGIDNESSDPIENFLNKHSSMEEAYAEAEETGKLAAQGFVGDTVKAFTSPVSEAIKNRMGSFGQKIAGKISGNKSAAPAAPMAAPMAAPAATPAAPVKAPGFWHQAASALATPIKTAAINKAGSIGSNLAAKHIGPVPAAPMSTPTPTVPEVAPTAAPEVGHKHLTENNFSPIAMPTKQVKSARPKSLTNVDKMKVVGKPSVGTVKNIAKPSGKLSAMSVDDEVDEDILDRFLKKGTESEEESEYDKEREEHPSLPEGAVQQIVKDHRSKGPEVNLMDQSSKKDRVLGGQIIQTADNKPIPMNTGKLGEPKPVGVASIADDLGTTAKKTGIGAIAGLGANAVVPGSGLVAAPLASALVGDGKNKVSSADGDLIDTAKKTGIGAMVGMGANAVLPGSGFIAAPLASAIASEEDTTKKKQEKGQYAHIENLKARYGGDEGAPENFAGRKTPTAGMKAPDRPAAPGFGGADQPKTVGLGSLTKVKEKPASGSESTNRPVFGGASTETDAGGDVIEDFLNAHTSTADAVSEAKKKRFPSPAPEDRGTDEKLLISGACKQ